MSLSLEAPVIEESSDSNNVTDTAAMIEDIITFVREMFDAGARTVSIAQLPGIKHANEAMLESHLAAMSDATIRSIHARIAGANE